jgi:hypothetical protein
MPIRNSVFIYEIFLEDTFMNRFSDLDFFFLQFIMVNVFFSPEFKLSLYFILAEI